ncbi:Protein of unknown function [Singulisphaera sp. GP187]|uniref:DUF1571 domain-containing protein n=1 Tax=Singulisphaera sp. GP187 TaxID=1882752 RepID=UPI00092B7112|nr:DUF1571 domain-containing protein [Singulisphaera sp. GP187]SIO18651.1 Protein of unknown function [Singulisphaera sp. GP187]
MIPKPRPRLVLTDRGQAWKGRSLATLAAALGLSATVWAGADRGGWELPPGTLLYSTAEAPREYRGPRPTLQLAMTDPTAATSRAEHRFDSELVRAQNQATESNAVAPSTASEAANAHAKEKVSDKEKEEVPRVASAAGRARPQGLDHKPGSAASLSPLAAEAEVSHDPIVIAKQAIADCQDRYNKIQDYTCTFHKRERIDGRLTQPFIMAMKSRTQPHSIYFKFQRPKKGREAIYVAGRHDGKIVVHDVGLGKLIAGTMNLDPKGSMAMEENRHPVTEAGIGALIASVARHWAIELTPGESRVTIHKNLRVANHPCTMIESVHPEKHPSYMFHMVKLYIDHEHGLPIRFEAYDWPKRPGAAPELVEEYSYLNLRTNVGLHDRDFDATNPQYSYGRF